MEVPLIRGFLNRSDFMRKQINKELNITDSEWESSASINKQNRDYVDEWLDDIIKRSKSEQTYKQYKSALRIFANWIGKHPFYKIKKRKYIQFQNWLFDEGLSANSIKFKRSAISSFCNFLETYIAEEDLDYETFRNFVKGTEIPSAVEKVYDKQPITYEEFKKIQLKLMIKKKYMLHALITTLFYSGNRITEVLQLRVSDLYTTNVVEKVSRRKIPEGKQSIASGDIRAKGKGLSGKIVNIRINKDMIRTLCRYCEKYRKDTDSEYIFNGQKDMLSQETVRTYFRTVVSEIVGRRINPHSLRGSFATYLLNKGVDIDIVRQLLNHKNIETTSKFYDLRSKEDTLDKELGKIDF